MYRDHYLESEEQAEEGGWTIEIELPGGEILRVSAGCRTEDLRAVLAELRRC